MNKVIGFIGLGNMGKGMSKNLSANNLKVLGFDIDDTVFSKIKNYNITKRNTIKSLTEESDIIITMLPDGNAVEKVWDEMIKYSKPNQCFIDCSTIDVKTSILLQRKAQEKNIFTLDAPVSGGVIGAENATLTFMAGGELKVYEQYNFLFNIMGKNSILCGNSGAGQSAKICNNMLLATTMIAVGESFKLGKALGLDLNKLYDVLSSSTGSCWAINTYCPIKGVGPKSPSDNNYEGGFASSLMLKDLSLACISINETETSIDYGLQSHKKFQTLVEKGHDNLDFSNIVNH